MNHFDYNYYITKYKDLTKLSKEPALKHFKNYGIKERRKFNKLLDKFDYNFYISKYKDLSKMNYLQACNHYINHGIKEKRECYLLKIYKPKKIPQDYDITVIINSFFVIY